jgi:hypothetical protein
MPSLFWLKRLSNGLATYVTQGDAVSGGYTLPSELRDIAYQNNRVIYDLLMKAAAETTLAIAADPKRLGARIGITAVLHTWGSALTQNPHSRYRALSSP